MPEVIPEVGMPEVVPEVAIAEARVPEVSRPGVPEVRMAEVAPSRAFRGNRPAWDEEDAFASWDEATSEGESSEEAVLAEGTSVAHPLCALARTVIAEARRLQPEWRWKAHYEGLVFECLDGLVDSEEVRQRLFAVVEGGIADPNAQCFKYVFNPFFFRKRFERLGAPAVPRPEPTAEIPASASPLARHALMVAARIRPRWLAVPGVVVAAEGCVAGLDDTDEVRSAIERVVDVKARGLEAHSPLYLFHEVGFRTSLQAVLEARRSASREWDNAAHDVLRSAHALLAPNACVSVASLSELQGKIAGLLANDGMEARFHRVAESLREVNAQLEAKSADAAAGEARRNQAREAMESVNLLEGTPAGLVLAHLRRWARTTDRDKREVARVLHEAALLFAGGEFQEHREEAAELYDVLRRGEAWPPRFRWEPDLNATAKCAGDGGRSSCKERSSLPAPLTEAPAPLTLQAPPLPLGTLASVPPSRTPELTLAEFVLAEAKTHRPSWNVPNDLLAGCLACTSELPDVDETRKRLRGVLREVFEDEKATSFASVFHPTFFRPRYEARRAADELQRLRDTDNAKYLVRTIREHLRYSPSQDAMAKTMHQALDLVHRGAVDQTTLEEVLELAQELHHRMKSEATRSREERLANIDDSGLDHAQAAQFLDELRLSKVRGALPPAWDSMVGEFTRLLEVGAFGEDTEEAIALREEIRSKEPSS